MSMREWKIRNEMWRNGYYVVASELMKWCYDWELDPMCDCTPARKIWTHTGEWRVDVYKAYIDTDGKTIRTCSEKACTADSISKEEAIKIWLNIASKAIPLNTVMEYFETVTLEAKAIQLMP